MSTAVSRPDPPPPVRLTWAGVLLGFALGGFFDSILLHQVLQWHHLLSAVPGVQDIRVQVLADGLFHALMYVVALGGVALLWTGRRALAARGVGHRLPADALVGFGVWHVLDGVVSHWVLGIHRIRMDVADPLLWDLAWFVVFGVVPAALGWWLRRQGGGSGGLRPAVALTLAVLAAGPVAALPPAGDGPVVVLFRSGVTPADVFGALAAVDGRTVWSDASGQLWAVDLPAGGNPMRLYRHGALLVSRSLPVLGCLNWFRG